MTIIKFFILGVLTVLIFPPFFMFPLGFIIFPYLINLLLNKLTNKSSLNLFSYGFCFGLGFLLIYLSWIYNPFFIYEDTKVFAWIAFLLPIFLSIFFGLSFLLYRFVSQNIYLILITPLIFIFIEYLISNIAYGFPWVTFSLILSNNLLGFYLIKFFGTLTSGFLVILFFLLPVIFLNFKKNKQVNKITLLAFTPFLLVLIIPLSNIFFKDNNFSKEITVDIYQILSPINKIDKKKIEENIINIIEKSNSEYIIFAENNYPYIIDQYDDLSINKYIKKNKKIIIGATRKQNFDYKNSFLLIENNNIQYFDKMILVPFGEFLPFRKYLKFMYLISGSIDYKTGNIERVLKTRDNINILPAICYEIIFDQIFQNINKNNIDLIINITNDSWFGNKIGPYQHFYITRLKSLISNKPLVRVSNNGISAIIDQNGKIERYSLLNKFSNISHKIKINKSFSYYFLHNFYSIYLIFLFIILFLYNRNNINYEK